MQQLTRRHLLLSSSLVVLSGYAGMGASCNLGAVAPIVVAGFHTLGQGILLAAPQLQRYGLSDNAAGQVQKYAGLIRDLANGVQSTTPVVAGQDVLTKIEGYVNAIAPIVAPFVSLVPGGTIIGLIIAMLPEEELALNFLVSLISETAKQIAATAPPLPAAARLGAEPVPYPRINQLIQVVGAR